MELQRALDELCAIQTLASVLRIALFLFQFPQERADRRQSAT